jgi:transposase
MAIVDVQCRQCAFIEFPAKVGNSTRVIYERLRDVYGDACMGASSVRRWVKYFKDGNTDIADQPLCGRPRTAVTERNKHEVHELIRQDRRITVRETAAQLGAPCGPGDDGDTGISEILFPLGFSLAYEYRGTEHGWELLSHPPYQSGFGPAQTTTCSGP